MERAVWRGVRVLSSPHVQVLAGFVPRGTVKIRRSQRVDKSWSRLRMLPARMRYVFIMVSERNVPRLATVRNHEYEIYPRALHLLHLVGSHRRAPVTVDRPQSSLTRFGIRCRKLEHMPRLGVPESSQRSICAELSQLSYPSNYKYCTFRMIL